MKVEGVDVDAQTRCAHYRSPRDVIAIKMRCCGIYHACKDCHDALADHPARVWPQSEWDQQAILCGACGTELTIHQYLRSGYSCPACRAQFNPRCRNHFHFYFEQL